MAARQKRYRIPRRVPGSLSKAVKAHNQQVGNILWAWNLAHDQLFQMFEYFVDDQRLASNLWHVLNSDKTQREMLTAAALAELDEQSALFQEIKWVLDRISDISTYRNDPAHTPIYVGRIYQTGSVLIPSRISGRPQAVQRLNLKPTRSFWRAARGDLYALAAYAKEICLRLRNQDQPPHWLGPLPRRPELLTLPQKAKRAPQKPRLQGGKARQRPPSSS